jgi:putative FmdB family regulatory protein
MPIYEYRCGACGHELEALQKLRDEPLVECSECPDGQLKRLISAPNFRLKGSGWYETDFKSDGDAKRNLADKGEANAASEDKGDKAKSDDGGAKSDTKVDAKTDGSTQTKSKAKSDGATKPASADKPKSKPSASDSAT